MLETLGMTLERNSSEHTVGPDPAMEVHHRPAHRDRREQSDLIREIRLGSSAAGFRRLFERYCAPVTHFFLNRGFSEQESEDLVQDTFLRVYRSIGTFRSDSSFETWLFSIVKNVWKNEIRGRRTQKRDAEEVPLEAVLSEDGDDGAVYSEPPDPLAGPFDQVLAGERERLLYRALDELPPKMRECVLLRICQDLKYREIAALLRVSIATVKSQLNAAKQRLGPLLEPHSDVLS